MPFDISAIDVASLIPVGMLVLGVLYCFFGYRFFKVSLGIAGFVLGNLLVRYFAASFLEGQATLAIVISIVAGIILSLLFAFIYLVGVFAIGSCLGGLLGLAVTVCAGVHPQLILLIVLAIVSGALALLLQKHVIIVATSLSGSGLAVVGGWQVARGVKPSTIVENPKSLGREMYAVLGSWLLLTLIGLVLQYRVTGKKGLAALNEKKKREE